MPFQGKVLKGRRNAKGIDKIQHSTQTISLCEYSPDDMGKSNLGNPRCNKNIFRCISHCELAVQKNQASVELPMKTHEDTGP